MSTAVHLVSGPEDIRVDCSVAREETDSQCCQDEARWTTKQVVAACLWSAFFGLGCGYAWLFLQIGTAGCR
jgi:hypothetical protein